MKGEKPSAEKYVYKIIVTALLYEAT